MAQFGAGGRRWDRYALGQRLGVAFAVAAQPGEALAFVRLLAAEAADGAGVAGPAGGARFEAAVGDPLASQYLANPVRHKYYC